MRFIATADWQLGMTAHFLDDEARPRFHQARFDAVRRIGELAKELEAQFVVVAGDVFESNQLHRAVISRTLEALSAYEVPVVLLPGNHDPLDAASIYDDPAFLDRVPEHVHVIREGGVYELMPGVEIVGAPWFSKRPLTDLVADACSELEPKDDGTVRVILGHGAVSTLNPDREDPATIDVPAIQELLVNGTVDAAILGDRHGTYEVAESIWYPGAPEVTHRREEDPGNVLLVEISPEGATFEKHPIGNWVFLTVEAYLGSEDDVAAFSERLANLPNKERTALWLALTGTLSTKARADLDRILDELSDVFARLDFWDRHTELVTVADDSDFRDLGLSGFAAEALAELNEVAGAGGEVATTAQDALGMLYRFAAGEAGAK